MKTSEILESLSESIISLARENDTHKKLIQPSGTTTDGYTADSESDDGGSGREYHPYDPKVILRTKHLSEAQKYESSDGEFIYEVVKKRVKKGSQVQIQNSNHSTILDSENSLSNRPSTGGSINGYGPVNEPYAVDYGQNSNDSDTWSRTSRKSTSESEFADVSRVSRFTIERVLDGLEPTTK